MHGDVVESVKLDRLWRLEFIANGISMCFVSPLHFIYELAEYFMCIMRLFELKMLSICHTTEI